MYDFAYHKPKSVADAVAAVKKGDEGKFMAGGMTLIPTLAALCAGPPTSSILRHRRPQGHQSTAHVTIGAMTRHAEVASSAEVAKAIPALAKLAANIGDGQVRNRGTIGGSVANNDPAADYPAALVALGATVHTNERKIAADDFFKGMFETALKDGEMITAVSFPVPKKAAYMKFPNPASRYAMVGVLADTAGGARRRHRRRPGRVPGEGHGSRAGQDLSADAVAGIKAGRRAEQRHPRQPRIPRAPGDGDGEEGGGCRGLMTLPRHSEGGLAPALLIGTSVCCTPR